MKEEKTLVGGRVMTISSIRGVWISLGRAYWVRYSQISMDERKETG